VRAIKATNRVGFVPKSFTEDITSWSKKAVAIFEFEATEPMQVSIKKGDILTVHTTNALEDWWEGENQGQTGFFPSTYLCRGYISDCCLQVKLCTSNHRSVS
jgi:hypothetical protein